MTLCNVFPPERSIPANDGMELSGTFPKLSGTFPKLSGSFRKLSGSFRKLSGSFRKPYGSFRKPSGSFPKPSGTFPKPYVEPRRLSRKTLRGAPEDVPEGTAGANPRRGIFYVIIVISTCLIRMIPIRKDGQGRLETAFPTVRRKLNRPPVAVRGEQAVVINRYSPLFIIKTILL